MAGAMARVMTRVMIGPRTRLKGHYLARRLPTAEVLRLHMTLGDDDGVWGS
jgi:hypothetical protein